MLLTTFVVKVIYQFFLFGAFLKKISWKTSYT